jgi:predicted transposase YbfD/YdcC
MLEPGHETSDGDHGRIEVRRHSVCYDVDWLFSDRRYKDEPRFPNLAMIGMVETRVERHGKTQHERRYYLSSAKLDAKAFAQAVRAHWGIENRLHWVLDVVFHDDLVRLRTDNGPHNMALVRHIAMNLVRNPKDKHSLKVRRKLANLNPDYLETLIRQTQALT